MARGVLCCGNLVYDILVRPVDQFRFDTTTWVEEISPHAGGNGANTSYALARLGVPVKLTGAIGQDAFGDSVLDRLETCGVDTSAVARVAEPTPTTVGLVSSSGSRAFLHCPGASAAVTMYPPDFTRAFIGSAAYFHLANPFAMPGLRSTAMAWVRAARQANLRTSMDLGWDARGEWDAIVEPCLPFLDLLFANEEEALMLTGAANVTKAAGVLRARGAGTVVVKLGAAGCGVFTAGSELRVAAFPVNALDTTGAGDCFSGGFLAGLYYGSNLEGAARLANAVGALSVSRLGGTEGLLSYKETLQWMAREKVTA